MENKRFDLMHVSTTLVAILIFLFMLCHSLGLLFGTADFLLSYLNIASKEPLKVITIGQTNFFKAIGISSLVTAGLFLVSIIKRETLNLSKAYVLKYAIWVAICTVALYGFLMRSVSNQQGAALLFFFTTLLYLVFSRINETNGQQSSLLLNNIALLPLYAVLFYTMGFPGWAKIFGGEAVIVRYIGMFKDSFIASLPGGIPFMIYVLGVLELLVPVLLIISLIKGEFRQTVSKLWLNYALVVTILTFVMLCFGLSVILNFVGSANLVFYAIFTFLMFVYINRSSEHQKLTEI
ncbi:hypothetical protein [Pedobacter sp.]|uniref:hypothetical protein n=1 Tax=Pedobacter sp. TaxID=1411316 RepID=UPI0031CEB42E